MDRKRHEQLISKIHQQETAGSVTVLPLVSLEDFFQIFQATRSRPNVQDVLVEIMEADEDPTVWPFSERIYVLAYATAAEVEEWVKLLQPSDVGEGWASAVSSSAPTIVPGNKVFSVLWD